MGIWVREAMEGCQRHTFKDAVFIALDGQRRAVPREAKSSTDRRKLLCGTAFSWVALDPSHLRHLPIRYARPKKN